jgi:hypothetical protein
MEGQRDGEREGGGASLFGFSWEAVSAGGLVLSGNEGVEVSEANGVAASSSFLPGSEVGASLWEAEEAKGEDKETRGLGDTEQGFSEWRVVSSPGPSLALRACVALV